MTATRRRRPRSVKQPGPATPEARVADGVRWRMALLALAVVVTYANSLSGAFVLDDQAAVVQNPQIRDLGRLGDVLMPRADSPVAGRPLPSLTFAVNYAAGALDVRGYHLVNMSLHLACVLLAFGLVRRTIDLPRVRARLGDGGVDLACAAALVWAVHPLNSEVVNYITQRTESMMALCYLGTMYAAVRAVSAPRPAIWELLAVLTCALGMACKESMATAPLMVALYDRVFIAASWREVIGRRKAMYAGLAGTWIALAALMVSGPRQATVGLASGVSPWTYLLNQTVIITDYLRLAVWPRELVAFYGWPVSLTLGDVLPYAVFVGGLFVLAVGALVRVPLLGFPGAWFFVTLAPASSVVPVATEVGAERRMYLPLLALVVLGVLAVDYAWRRTARAPDGREGPPRAISLVPAILLLVVSAALAWGTIGRNREYASALTLTQTVAERRPTSVAHHMFGEQLLAAGRRDEAVGQLTQAVEKGNSRAGLLLGAALFEQGNPPAAVARLEAFIRSSEAPRPLVPRWLEPPATEVVDARLALGQIFASQREWRRAGEQAVLVLAAFPRHVGAKKLLADMLFEQQQWETAAGHYRDYLLARPADVQALINFGVTKVATGNLDDAIAAFGRAVDVEPANVRAAQLLGLARADRARLAAATP